jgi:hypothetical protein
MQPGPEVLALGGSESHITRQSDRLWKAKRLSMDLFDGLVCLFVQCVECTIVVRGFEWRSYSRWIATQPEVVYMNVTLPTLSI